MKNISFLLISLLLLGCSKNSDDLAPEVQNFTLTLNIDPTHYGEFFVSAKAFLSDKNGEILAEDDVFPGQETTLSIGANPGQNYDLSIMLYRYLDFVDEKIYGITTFTDIQPGMYDLGPGPTSEDSFDEIYINLTNAGFPCIVMSGATGHAPFGPENGGYVNYRGNLVGSPSSDFYIAFIGPNDQYYRYFWGEDILEGSVFDIAYPSLPEIQNVESIQLPANDRATFSLHGMVGADTDSIQHAVGLGNYVDGIAALSVPVPLGIFDQYLFAVTFGTADKGYFKNQMLSNLPEEVTAPIIDFTVTDESLGNFNMQTEGDAKLFSATFRTSILDPAISISHTVYGPVSPTVSFSMENLWMNIREYYPDLSTFSNLPLGSVSISDFSGIGSYSEVLRRLVEGQNIAPTQLGEHLEGTSQLFD